jgi:hypothetical protein
MLDFPFKSHYNLTFEGIMKVLKNFRPLLLAFLTFLFYLLIYRPPLDTGAEDFVTALMVFFAALGWSGIIIYTKEKRPGLAYLYAAVSIIGPVAMYFLFKGFNTLFHFVAFALFLIALVGLKFFTDAHVRHEERERKQL